MSENRIRYLDISRGIGILMVMYSHSLYNSIEAMTYVSGVFIPLFFIISGFLSKPLTGGGYFRRIKYLLGPYVFFNFFLGLIFIIINRDFNVHNLVGVFYSRFYLYPVYSEHNIRLMEMWNSPMWFLTAMVVSLLLFRLPFIKIIKEQYSVYWKISCVIFFLIGFYFMQFLPVLLPWSIDVAPFYALMMLVGYGFKKYNIHNIHWAILVALCIIYFLLCYYNGSVNLSTRIYGKSPFIIFITGILGSILIIRLAMWFEKIPLFSTVLSKIGENSTCIFCTHVFVFSVLLKIEQCFEVNSTHNSLLLLIIEIVVASVIGVALSHLLRKYVPSVFR